MREALLQSLLADDAAALEALLTTQEVSTSTQISLTADALAASPRFRSCSSGPVKGRFHVLKYAFWLAEVGLLQAAVRLGAIACSQLLLRRHFWGGSTKSHEVAKFGNGVLQPRSALQEAAYHHDGACVAAIMGAGPLELSLRELTMLFAGLKADVCTAECDNTHMFSERRPTCCGELVKLQHVGI